MEGQMQPDQYTEVKVLLERMSVSLENVNKEIGEIKEAMIPDGKNRLTEVEDDVKILTRFKNGAAAIIMLVCLLLPFSERFLK